jgi:hypothetical protein
VDVAADAQPARVSLAYESASGAPSIVTVCVAMAPSASHHATVKLGSVLIVAFAASPFTTIVGAAWSNCKLTDAEPVDVRTTPANDAVSVTVADAPADGAVYVTHPFTVCPAATATLGAETEQALTPPVQAAASAYVALTPPGLRMVNVSAHCWPPRSSSDATRAVTTGCTAVASS